MNLLAKTKIAKAPAIRDERAFHNVALVLMTILALYCIVPFILMISVSFSSEASLLKGYRFWPAEFSMNAYNYLWIKRLTILRSYGITILVTVVGTAVNLVLTSMFAYPLSRRDFKPRNVFAFILFFRCRHDPERFLLFTGLFFPFFGLLLPFQRLPCGHAFPPCVQRCFHFRKPPVAR